MAEPEPEPEPEPVEDAEAATASHDLLRRVNSPVEDAIELLRELDEAGYAVDAYQVQTDDGVSIRLDMEVPEETATED